MLFDLSPFALATLIAVFLVAAVVITLAGTRLARMADVIADHTGLGEAATGAILLGGTTSLPGILTSVTTAGFGYPQLAIGNAIGGIAAQTVFLAIADLVYRRANLEHAAADLTNIAQGVVLIGMLSLALMAAAMPPITVLAVSPFSVAMLCMYVAALRLTSRMSEQPMWLPHHTGETKVEAEEEGETVDRPVRLYLGFGAMALITALAGLALAESAVAITQRTGISATAVGALMTAVVTSMPELVTSVAAVRAGALNLAVGGILGGNAFDVLFLAFADVAYRDGSLYAAFQPDDRLMIATTSLMTVALVLGLLRREPEGLWRIGFEGVAVLGLYLLFGVMIAL